MGRDIDSGDRQRARPVVVGNDGILRGLNRTCRGDRQVGAFVSGLNARTGGRAHVAHIDAERPTAGVRRVDTLVIDRHRARDGNGQICALGRIDRTDAVFICAGDIRHINAKRARALIDCQNAMLDSLNVPRRCDGQIGARAAIGGVDALRRGAGHITHANAQRARPDILGEDTISPCRDRACGGDGEICAVACRLNADTVLCADIGYVDGQRAGACIIRVDAVLIARHCA